MHPNDFHHIKAYFVFFVLSASLISLLIYLYIPDSLQSGNMGSSALINPTVSDGVSNTPLDQSESSTSGARPSGSLQVSDELSKKRIRLTKMLLRLQSQLQTFEEQRKDSENGLDATLEENIKLTREKISTTEKLITELR